MRTPATSRLISFAALLPLLMVTISGLGYERFRCAFTGEVSEAGCCPTEDAPATPVLDGASCCTHESALPLRLPAEASSPPALAIDAAVATPAPFALAAPRAAVPAPRARAHAPPRPPLVLLKQSFLI